VQGLYVLSSKTLVTRDDLDRLYLWDIEKPDTQIELCNPEQPVFCSSQFLCALLTNEGLYLVSQVRPLEVLIVGERFAIVVRPTVLEIYGIPDQNSSGAPVIYPMAYHEWQWKLDSVCVSTQASQEAAHRKELAPIVILVRYGSLLPWVRRLNSYDV
jgi:hypothetical protein